MPNTDPVSANTEFNPEEGMGHCHCDGELLDDLELLDDMTLTKQAIDAGTWSELEEETEWKSIFEEKLVELHFDNDDEGINVDSYNNGMEVIGWQLCIH